MASQSPSLDPSEQFFRDLHARWEDDSDVSPTPKLVKSSKPKVSKVKVQLSTKCSPITPDSSVKPQHQSDDDKGKSIVKCSPITLEAPEPLAKTRIDNGQNRQHTTSQDSPRAMASQRQTGRTLPWKTKKRPADEVWTINDGNWIRTERNGAMYDAYFAKKNALRKSGDLLPWETSKVRSRYAEEPPSRLATKAKGFDKPTRGMKRMPAEDIKPDDTFKRPRLSNEVRDGVGRKGGGTTSSSNLTPQTKPGIDFCPILVTLFSPVSPLEPSGGMHCQASNQPKTINDTNESIPPASTSNKREAFGYKIYTSRTTSSRPSSRSQDQGRATFFESLRTLSHLASNTNLPANSSVNFTEPITTDPNMSKARTVHSRDFNRPKNRAALQGGGIKPPATIYDDGEETPEPEESLEEMEADAKMRALRGHIKTRTAPPPQGPSESLKVLENAIKEAAMDQDLPFDSFKGEDAEYSRSRFLCMQPHKIDKTAESCPNAPTILLLLQLSAYYGRHNDEWRAMQYRKAASQLRRETTKVTTKRRAMTLPYVGQSIAAKIEEIALTGRLRVLEDLLKEPKDQVICLFTGIYGCAAKQALSWYSQGYRTFDDLLSKANLTENQRVGIEHYDDFQKRIPRAEIEEHANFIRPILSRLDPNFRFVIGGSYRRGSPDSGDIDILITAKDKLTPKMLSKFHQFFLARLEYPGYLKWSFIKSHRERGAQYYVAACLPKSDHKTWRRVDFLLVPPEQWGAALLYFTGNDIFNRSMRSLARKKGMRLKGEGISKDVQRGKGGIKVTDGALIPTKDEKEIFDILGVPWRRPEERNP